MTQAYVTYIRVSTAKQGQSGLGLEAQRESVEQFCAKRQAVPIEEYVEVESGANNDRPQLRAALNACALYGVPLLIAKLDRLSRSAAFIMTLQEAKVKFVCVDNPEVNEETVGILAVVARGERERGRVRTREAMQAAKRRGVKMGGLRPGGGFTAENQAKGPKARRAKSKERAMLYQNVVNEVRQAGNSSLRAIADELNARNVPTPSGRYPDQDDACWYPATVKRVLEVIDAD